MEPDPDACEGVHTALLAVDDTDRCPALETRFAKGSNRLRESPAGGDDVLDHTHPLSLLERSLDAVRRPVLLGLVADDHERKPGGDRGRGGEHDCAEDRACEPGRFGLELLDSSGQALPERAENVGLGLEAELVEVEARPSPRAEDE